MRYLFPQEFSGTASPGRQSLFSKPKAEPEFAEYHQMLLGGQANLGHRIFSNQDRTDRDFVIGFLAISSLLQGVKMEADKRLPKDQKSSDDYSEAMLEVAKEQAWYASHDRMLLPTLGVVKRYAGSWRQAQQAKTSLQPSTDEPDSPATSRGSSISR